MLLSAKSYCRLQLELWRDSTALSKSRSCRSKFQINKQRQPPLNVSLSSHPAHNYFGSPAYLLCKNSFRISEQEREDKYYAYENKYELHLNQGNDLSHLKYIYIKKKIAHFRENKASAHLTWTVSCRKGILNVPVHSWSDQPGSSCCKGVLLG